MYQKHILDLLRKADSLRYTELQPDGVESSHFKYHLNQLIRDGVVAQLSRGVYALSENGKSFVDTLSEGLVVAEVGPKVITYTLLFDDDNFYLYRKDKEPYRGLLNMIGGKVHMGESTKDTAIREVHEKAQISLSEITQVGTAEVRILQHDELLTHAVIYVYMSKLPVSADVSSLERVNQQSVSETKDLAPDAKDIVTACSSPGFSLNLSIAI